MWTLLRGQTTQQKFNFGLQADTVANSGHVAKTWHHLSKLAQRFRI